MNQNENSLSTLACMAITADVFQWGAAILQYLCRVTWRHMYIPTNKEHNIFQRIAKRNMKQCEKHHHPYPIRTPFPSPSPPQSPSPSPLSVSSRAIAKEEKGSPFLSCQSLFVC